MTIPRRSLIRAAVGTTAALLAHPLTLIAAETGDPPIITGPLDYAAFRSLLQTWFFLANTETHAAGEARLVGVKRVSRDERCEQFRIAFILRPGLELPGGLYHATNWGGHPEFDVYVKSASTRLGRHYLLAEFALLRPEVGDAS